MTGQAAGLLARLDQVVATVAGRGAPAFALALDLALALDAYRGAGADTGDGDAWAGDQVEGALLQAAAVAGVASEVYSLTQRVRLAHGLARRLRMPPAGRGQPSPHPELGAAVQVTMRLPGPLVARVDAAAAALGLSRAAWVCDTIRSALVLDLLGPDSGA